MKVWQTVRTVKRVALIALPFSLLLPLRYALRHRNDVALFDEAWKGQPNLVEMQHLINEGANVNYRDRSGLTPLQGAQNVKACKFLIDNGAKVNVADWVDGQTPLMIAAWDGNESVVRLLLSKGAKVSQKDKGGRTALSFTLTNTKFSLNHPMVSPPTGFRKRNYTSVIKLLKIADAKERRQVKQNGNED